MSCEGRWDDRSRAAPAGQPVPAGVIIAELGELDPGRLLEQGRRLRWRPVIVLVDRGGQYPPHGWQGAGRGAEPSLRRARRRCHQPCPAVTSLIHCTAMASPGRPKSSRSCARAPGARSLSPLQQEASQIGRFYLREHALAGVVQDIVQVQQEAMQVLRDQGSGRDRRYVSVGFVTKTVEDETEPVVPEDVFRVHEQGQQMGLRRLAGSPEPEQPHGQDSGRAQLDDGDRFESGK